MADNAVEENNIALGSVGILKIDSDFKSYLENLEEEQKYNAQAANCSYPGRNIMKILGFAENDPNSNPNASEACYKALGKLASSN